MPSLPAAPGKGRDALSCLRRRPGAALGPSLGLAFRAVLTFVLITAVRAAWRATALRKQAARAARLPVARVVQRPTTAKPPPVA